MNYKEELIGDSDTSDDDYVPDKKLEVLSEVESDGDPEDSLSEAEDRGQKNTKRKRKSTQARKKQKIIEDDSSIQKPADLTEEEKKKKEEDIWNDFMRDTGFKSRKNIDTSISTAKIDSSTPKSTLSKLNSKDANLTYKPQEKVKITKIFEFAGEEVKVEKEVPVDSAEVRLFNKPTPHSTQSKNKRGGLNGIGGILNQLGKKPKISTLEKSKLDWDQFKKEKNLEEELQSYNKGRDGYLEKQDFLQRADLRRFEIEKDIRSIERNRRMNNSL